MADRIWASGVVPSAGEDIAYETTGSGGDAVVLCHGLGGNHAVWYQQVPVLAEQFRVVTWDQRGFGRSTNRANASSPAVAVTDLTALLDHLEIDRAHLIGQSMGGWCVLGFALQSPERVRSLVIADSTAGVINDTITDALQTIERREVPSGVAGAHRAIGERFRREDPAGAFLYQEIGAFRGDVDEGAMIATLFGTRYPLDEVQALRKSALCIVGTDDDLIPPAAVREVATILDAYFVEIPGAGHSPYFENPEEWNKEVLEFLEGVA